VNILIVDDYPSNRKLLRSTLEAEGHAILEAGDGVEALKLLELGDVDAVISDILMPSMDGFRLCQEIRRSESINPGVPIILYTATYNSASDRELASAVGADGYVMKPAPTPTILAALSEAREKARNRTVTAPSKADEGYVLERYNAVLVRKLESRNNELHHTLASLRAAHEQILELNQSLEARVAQRTMALDAANKELESFAHTVAHDLRAPLRQIAGYADLLAETEGALIDAESSGYLAQIRESARHMDQLMLDLLEFARTSRVVLDLEEVELESVLEEALALLLPDTQGRNIQWQRNRLPKVRGDAAMLRQVLVNILSNAIKYSRPRDPAIIEIGHRAGRAGEAVIFVRDNGVGFDMRHARGLFGVFKRLHAAADFEGTGVGMASAQRIIARHGGRIWAEAAVDRGATFSFSLQPAASD
jgi:signal transduction histidine kinase